MVQIRRILCPIDFSETSRHALEHAVSIAKWYESQITALHVINPAFMLEPQVIFTAFAESGPEDRRTTAKLGLRDWLQAAREAGLQTETRVVEGRPAQRILECASSLPADLIVTGTHGLGGFERFALGSVTEKVLRKAACPVLTVPPPVLTAPKLPYASLLCPVDFSESSLSALSFAFSIAKESGARLTILHVLDWPPDEELLVERFDTTEFRGLVEGRVRDRLDALLTDDVRTWCEPTVEISYGKPHVQILALAESRPADLIVMGVCGRNALDLALFGSTTHHVVRRASCPVLTLGR